MLFIMRQAESRLALDCINICIRMLHMYVCTCISKDSCLEAWVHIQNVIAEYNTLETLQACDCRYHGCLLLQPHDLDFQNVLRQGPGKTSQTLLKVTLTISVLGVSKTWTTQTLGCGCVGSCTAACQRFHMRTETPCAMCTTRLRKNGFPGN